MLITPQEVLGRTIAELGRIRGYSLTSTTAPAVPIFTTQGRATFIFGAFMQNFSSPNILGTLTVSIGSMPACSDWRTCTPNAANSAAGPNDPQLFPFSPAGLLIGTNNYAAGVAIGILTTVVGVGTCDVILVGWNA